MHFPLIKLLYLCRHKRGTILPVLAFRCFAIAENIRKWIIFSALARGGYAVDGMDDDEEDDDDDVEEDDDDDDDGQ